MAPVGWWASDAPLHLAHGRRVRGRLRREIHLCQDDRTKHAFVVGSSGSGKSRLLRHIICQDIARNRSFVLIDAQDLVRETLSLISEAAFGDILDLRYAATMLGDKLALVDPVGSVTNGTAPGINLLEVPHGLIPYSVVDGIIQILRELWPDAFGDRFADVCRNSMLVLQEQNLTVVELVPFLSDDAFRQAIVARSHNPELHCFFDGHLGGLRPAEVRMWLESSRNKWNALCASPYLRPILGQTRTTIDFRDVINDGRWLLVNASRNHLKDSRRFVGALVVQLIENAAISRENDPPSTRYFSQLVVDEFQDYFCPPFTRILEAGRKYGLGLCIAHQNFDQPPFDLKPAIIDTVIANCHTRIAFRVSHKDAQRMAPEIFHITGAHPKLQRSIFGIPVERPQFWGLAEESEHFANELMRQRTGQAAISFKGLGDDEPYMAEIPHVPDIEPDHEKIQTLRRHVASRYERPLQAIEQEIEERWARIRNGTYAFDARTRDFTR